jgi:hypothetical protein
MPRNNSDMKVFQLGMQNNLHHKHPSQKGNKEQKQSHTHCGGLYWGDTNKIKPNGFSIRVVKCGII